MSVTIKVPDINLNAREIVTEANRAVAKDLQKGKTKWPVRTGISRRGWHGDYRSIFNRVAYAKYVRPAGRPIGAATRDVMRYLKRHYQKYLDTAINKQ